MESDPSWHRFSSWRRKMPCLKPWASSSRLESLVFGEGEARGVAFVAAASCGFDGFDCTVSLFLRPDIIRREFLTFVFLIEQIPRVPSLVHIYKHKQQDIRIIRMRLLVYIYKHMRMVVHAYK